MGKEQKNNLIKRFIFNIYLRNILAMIGITLLIIWGVLWYLKIYTRHNDTIAVPDLKGLQEQDAQAIVASASLNYEIVDSLHRKDGIPGAILEQIPKEKSRVKKGRTIYLTIQAKSEPMIEIPDLQNASVRQAEALLNSLGFSEIVVKMIPSEYQDLVFGVEYNGQPLKPNQKVPQSSVLTLQVGDGVGSNGFSDIFPVVPEIEAGE